MKRWLITALKIILTAVVLYFVGRKLYVHWDEVRQYEWQISYPILIGSIILALVALFVFSVSWGRIVGGFGSKVSAIAAFRINYLAHLGRYVPGKIWQVVGMVYLAKQVGIRGESVAASFGISQLFYVPASILIYAVATLFEPLLLREELAFLGQGTAYLISGCLLALCLLVVVWPEPFLKAGNYILRKMGRQPATFQLDKTVALSVFAGYLLGWILFGLAFWLFLRSVLGDSTPSVLVSVGLYNAAYQVGYLALFAPGGFGPREFMMGLLLTPFVGPIATAVAVAARIWSLLIDLSAAALALCIKKQT